MSSAIEVNVVDNVAVGFVVKDTAADCVDIRIFDVEDNNIFVWPDVGLVSVSENNIGCINVYLPSEVENEVDGNAELDMVFNGDKNDIVLTDVVMISDVIDLTDDSFVKDNFVCWTGFGIASDVKYTFGDCTDARIASDSENNVIGCGNADVETGTENGVSSTDVNVNIDFKESISGCIKVLFPYDMKGNVDGCMNDDTSSAVEGVSPGIDSNFVEFIHSDTENLNG